VTLNLAATDAGGVTGYYVSTSTTPPAATATGWEEITSTPSFSKDLTHALSSGDGEKKVYAWYKDAAEHVSNMASASIFLDQTPPNGTLTATAGNAKVTLSWSFSDGGGSGLASTDPYKLVFSTGGYPAASCTSGSQLYTGSNTSFTHTKLTNGLKYWYRVCPPRDNAGNISSGVTASATPQAGKRR
jgi:hypothetical protein